MSSAPKTVWPAAASAGYAFQHWPEPPRLSLAELEPALAVEPFATAEQAFFWYVAALQARADGAVAHSGEAEHLRPNEANDIALAFRRIDLGPDHKRVLERCACDHQVPDPTRRPADARLWAEAMRRLEEELRPRGIVATPEDAEQGQGNAA